MDKTRIQVRVTPEQKAEWKSHVADTEQLQSMSHLVRIAVQDYILDEEKQEAQTNEKIADLLEYVVEQQLEIKQQIDELEENQVTQGDIDALQSQIDDIQE